MHRHDYTFLLRTFEDYLAAHQPYGSPDSLYEPIRYINELGGKRIRPVLLLMAYNLYQEDVTPALPAAMAVEYFHNFSLMHDDIMDEAPLRRGKETVHYKFNRNAAILSGDAMLIRCFELLLQAGERSGVGAQLNILMCKASLEICEGQQMDMDFEKIESPTEAEYLEVIRKKTSCLFGVSLELGATLAGAPEAECRALYSFGESIGLGFQIQDDYLDVFGDISLTGKQKGGDILQGKKNFPYVHTYNKLSPPDRKEFAHQYALASRHQEIDSVLALYENQNVASYVLKKQKEYLHQAMTAIDAMDRQKVNGLVDFVQSLVHREF
ncbi:MAG TPA: polyprenyl synthetase family protein [Saprospiraceae bacterium]|nr:polyprenyl synthetase family protein [Saprospiraceae bacterium]